MPQYVDGFVIPLPKKNLKAYQTLAKKAAKIWKEHGAVSYFECTGDDMTPGFGLPFPKLAKVKKGETVVFSWIVYKSKKHRDSVNAKVMKDKRVQDMCDPGNMPFDAKRMSYGGFQVLVKA